MSGTMKTLLYVLVILLVVYLVIKLFSKKTKLKLSSFQEGNIEKVISASELDNIGNSMDYTYSLWFYVDDWNYKYGVEKILWTRDDNSNQPSPSVSLGDMENNITISVACYPNNQSQQQGDEQDAEQDGGEFEQGPGRDPAYWRGDRVGRQARRQARRQSRRQARREEDTSILHKCTVNNFHLQKWVNLIVSMQGETLDVYLDGKLIKTCVLEGVPKVRADSNVRLTPNGGFKGWTSNFQYLNKSVNPREAYNIYRKGYSGGGLGNAFNKYQLRVEVLKNNEVAVGVKI